MCMLSNSSKNNSDFRYYETIGQLEWSGSRMARKALTKETRFNLCFEG